MKPAAHGQSVEEQEFTKGEAILTLDGLSKHFGGVTAIEGASFTVHSGQVVGLLGNNGAGKSTVVRMIAGTQEPDEGTILWCGEPVTLSSPAIARRLGIATVFQELALADDLDPTANIFLNRELYWGWGPLKFNRNRLMRRRADELLERFAIHLPPDPDLRSMSGGQRQSVAIARALAGGGRLLLLDEPTAALGVQETAHVEELILRLRNHGVGILIVSHDVKQILRLCDELVVFRRGTQVGVFPKAGMSEEDVVSLIVGA